MAQTTALAEAFRRAGILPPDVKLQEICGEAIAAVWRDPPPAEPKIGRQAPWATLANDNQTAAKLWELAMTVTGDASGRWEVAKAKALDAIRGDAALLWQLFEPYRAVAIHKLLSEAATALRQAERERGQGKHANQDFNASLPGSTTSHPRIGHELSAPASRTVPRLPTSARSAVAAASLLDTFMVHVAGGAIPIGRATPNQAVHYASARERDARFIKHLVAGIGPNEIIGRHRTPEEALDIWRRVSAEQQVSTEMTHGN